MSDQKFLGFCIIVAALILAGAIYFHGRTQRYQLVQGDHQIYVQDTVTGDTYLGWKHLLQ